MKQTVIVIRDPSCSADTIKSIQDKAAEKGILVITEDEYKKTHEQKSGLNNIYDLEGKIAEIDFFNGTKGKENEVGYRKNYKTGKPLRF